MTHAQRTSAARAAGFTLVELLAVLTILAILAAVAIPSLTRTAASGATEDAAGKLASVVFRAKMDAISSHERRVVVLGRSSFRLVNNPSSGPETVLLQGSLPSGAFVFNMTSEAAEPGSGYTVPTADLGAGELALCFWPTGSAGRGTASGALWTCAASPVTVFLQSEGGEWKSRIVIQSATGHSTTYGSW